MLGFYKSVPLHLIRHNDLPVYVNEGFGGKPLEFWPVTNFYKLYLDGETNHAMESYVDWYAIQLSKYAYTPKQLGGMYRGSLFNLIEKKLCKEFSQSLAEERFPVITQRIKHRFELLSNIKKNGYDMRKAEQIYAVKKRGAYYLLGGHHRAAALLVLDRKDLPGVIVLHGVIVYNLFRLFRKLKNYANF